MPAVIATICADGPGFARSLLKKPLGRQIACARGAGARVAGQVQSGQAE
jgi:hypothetical protein